MRTRYDLIRSKKVTSRRGALAGLATIVGSAVASRAEVAAETALPDEGAMPELGTGPRPLRVSNVREQPMPDDMAWLNSAPLNNASLRGKVVLVDFWTYTCINSLRNLPYMKAWAAKYRGAGLVVIGVHTPEFTFEHERANVAAAVRDLGVTYPIAIDSNYRIWQAFNNDYWPADYFVDGAGRIRHHHYGEGDYAESERVLRQLLQANGATSLPGSVGKLTPSGVEAAADFTDENSEETYLGYRRAAGFASRESVVRDASQTYSVPAKPALNQWGLDGSWTVGGERASLDAAPGKIVLAFHSRDLHLVMLPPATGAPARFRVRLDGAAPAANHGSDCAPDGTGEVRAPRLYQLIRQTGPIVDRIFEIEFFTGGVQAVVFTFG